MYFYLLTLRLFFKSRSIYLSVSLSYIHTYIHTYSVLLCFLNWPASFYLFFSLRSSVRGSRGWRRVEQRRIHKEANTSYTSLICLVPTELSILSVVGTGVYFASHHWTGSIRKHPLAPAVTSTNGIQQQLCKDALALKPKWREDCVCSPDLAQVQL